MVLKLDFAKAFDTVCWEGLFNILQARGFNGTWQRWILQIMQTSKSAVLVNGCPGPWINCRQGLRQGDPISPYLFILVADVLQALVRQCHQVRHPIEDDTPCPVLQYADDMLLLIRGKPEDIIQLKVCWTNLLMQLD